MMIHDITVRAGRYKARKRLGRGKGSGQGKTSGRGFKGAGSRTGHSTRHAFEGGQMPFFRRMQKFGFTNAKFRVRFWIVNLGDILKHPHFAKGGEVTIDRLIEAGLVRDKSRDLKILGNVGEEGVRVNLAVKASRVSDAARKLIESAGGSVQETGTRRDFTRGINRNSTDRAPKNLTKKLKRSRPPVATGKLAAPAPDEKAEKADKPEKAPKGEKGGEKGEPKAKAPKPPKPDAKG